MNLKKNRKINIQYKKNELFILLLLILLTIIIQSIVTYIHTNTKRFSIRALIRNLSFVICIYYFILTKKWFILLIPFILEIILEFLKHKGFHIEKYIATEYQYNDYWREINKENNIFSNFSEGNCTKILGIDTTDHSQKNIKKVLDWCEKTYINSIHNKTPYFLDFNGQKKYLEEIKKITENNKFKLICDICQIKPNMKILEIGFGEGDFINYIKQHYNIDVTGVSISDEQVNLIKSRGFNGYTMNFWEMTPEKIGTYDLILQCGNSEYIKCTGDNDEIYIDYCNMIKKLLNKNGKFFVTSIHFNENFSKWSLYDKLRCYFLWSGNDGSYPNGKDGFTKYAEKTGLKIKYQQERTNDYFIMTVLFMSYMRCSKNNTCVYMLSFLGILQSLFKTIAAPYYIHTYICYSPINDFYWLPWQWQFIPQFKNGKYVSPTTLEYILLEN